MNEQEYKNKYTKEYLAERLVLLRDGYKDEIPVRIIHSSDPDNKFKVRSAWFIGLHAELENSKIDGLLPSSVIEDVDKFLLWYTGDFGKRKGFPVINTKADIEKGNTIINKVLESLGSGQKT